jgi:transposase InsO family protein
VSARGYLGEPVLQLVGGIPGGGQTPSVWRYGAPGKHALPVKGPTEFTYFKIIGWCWYYLSSILDDCSRYIIAWKLCTNMRAEDVTDTIELALKASGCEQAVVRHKLRLLSDHGSCYISADLAKWLRDQKMTHVRGAPFHPQTQGKIPLMDCKQTTAGQWNSGTRP